jgi:hypothetical protein
LQIEAWLRRLLDLSAKNRLLSFSDTKASCCLSDIREVENSAETWHSVRSPRACSADTHADTNHRRLTLTRSATAFACILSSARLRYTAATA